MMKRARRWYTGHPTQIKYLLLVFASMLFPVALIWVCVSFVLDQIVTAVAMLPAHEFEKTIRLFERAQYFWTVGIGGSFAIIIVSGLYLSQQLAGPIRRLERQMDQVIAGDTKLEIQVRQKDDLRGIADRINQLVSKLRSG